MRFCGINLFFTIFLIWAAALSPQSAQAQQAQMTISGDPSWKITADRITREGKDAVYLAEGRIKMTRGREVIEADRARLHDESRTAEVQGNVCFFSEEFKIICRRMVFNLEHNIGKFYDGTIFFPANHYYISGDEIEKTGPDTLFLIKGRVTSCDGPNPAWSLTGRNISVRKEGYATIKHATISTRFFPLLYTPWMMIPVKENRQSGLLMPDLRDSTRDGLTATLPYYWAISDSKDMTFYLTHMQDRGLETCVEFRYNDWGGKGTYRFTSLHDQVPPTIEYSGDYESQVYEDRYWIRGMSDLVTESGFNIKFDLDFVSDPEYLDEFDRSFTGFNNTRTQFLREFGREPAEPLDPMRKNTLLVTKPVNRMSLNMSLEYTDNLEDPDNLSTIQRLPKIQLSFPSTAIPGTPFFFKSNSNYTYFARKTDEAGHRLDIHPRIYWPARVYKWLDIEPSVGFRETIYYPHGTDDPERSFKINTRELYNAQFEASTNLARIFNIEGERLLKLMHRVKPEITIDIVSDREQFDLPRFDGIDRLREKQSLKYGVVNYLTAKTRKAQAFPQVKKTSPPLVRHWDRDKVKTGDKNSEHEYFEFLRLGVWRTYDFVEARRDIRPRSAKYPPDFNRPNKPWHLELELDLSPAFWAQITSDYETYTEMFTDHTMEFLAQDERGDYFSLQYELNLEPYRLTKREEYEYEEISYLLNLVLNDELTFQWERRYSLMDEEDSETFYSLSYQLQCWGMRLEYMDRPGNRQIAVIFSLLGMGEIGTFSYTPSQPSTMKQEEL